MFQAGWRAMDVYQERAHQDREAARVKLLEPWLVPIVTLFEGRIVDKPEPDIPATEYSTGGLVEHEVYYYDWGSFVLVVEMKIGLFKDDNLAQLFLELLVAAAKLNKETGFGEQRVYGLLTDLSAFRFYSYDPVTETFNPDEDIFVNVRRDDPCSGMIYVGNKVFSVIMCAYVEGLRATVNASKKNLDTGDGPLKLTIPLHRRLNAVGSGLILQKPGVKYKPRLSLPAWREALVEAELAYSKLQQGSDDLATLQKTGSEGLKHLNAR
ncbi:hypothetical protein EST38_g10398 [Candolleomyces aberdarensis]|uniref:Uncharacterized protein n=1 Tax=Candolleomyces aberdarensis TaxID=2316362 RepID=A0A4Q2D857_9AGAR|nr:hypothetical protein EST38_g10398 [Candolleomyces aberdarensis]